MFVYFSSNCSGDVSNVVLSILPLLIYNAVDLVDRISKTSICIYTTTCMELWVQIALIILR